MATYAELTDEERAAIEATLGPMAEHAGKFQTLAESLSLSTCGNAWAYVAAAIAKLDDNTMVPNTSRKPQAMTVLSGAHLKGLVALIAAFKLVATSQAKALCVDVAGPLACSGKA